MSGESSLPGSKMAIFSLCPHMGKGALWGPFYKVTNPISEGSTLMSSSPPKRPHLLISHWKLGFNVWMLRADKHSAYSSTFPSESETPVQTYPGIQWGCVRGYCSQTPLVPGPAPLWLTWFQMWTAVCMLQVSHLRYKLQVSPPSSNPPLSLIKGLSAWTEFTWLHAGGSVPGH